MDLFHQHLFCIFDGHGGTKAAIYCKDNFARIVSKTIIGCSYDFKQCLITSFNKTNTDLLSKIKEIQFQRSVRVGLI